MITLTPLVLQLIQLGLAVAPAIIAAAIAEINLYNVGATPTADQQKQIDDALAAANTALQAATQG